MSKIIARRWQPFIPTIKAFALHLKRETAHPNSQGIDELSEVLEIHRNTVSFWFNGKYSPNDATMELIDCASKTHKFNPNKIR